MQVTLNTKGTLSTSFTIGKNGVTLYQGDNDPYPVYTPRNGDYWLDSTDNSLRVWSSVSNDWSAPKLADLTFSGSSITTTSDDLTLQTNGANSKVIFAGDVGPGIITASASQDLYIDPTLGGGSNLILIDNKWPAADGVASQVLTTDGAGNLSFTTPNKIGSPSLATDATSGFGYIPTIAGTPSGTPTAITGYAPMMVDPTNSKMWVYVNGVWKYIPLL